MSHGPSRHERTQEPGMNKRIEDLAGQIRLLEAELAKEIQRIRIQTYEIRDRTVRFGDEIRQRHRAQMVGVMTYLRHSELKHILSAPVVWCCLLPAVMLDLVVTLFQAICFPLYGIPKVRRADFVVIDRHHLAYLNVIEKLNCLYCSYFNGVIAYVREVAGRTEQYWCPIKHAAQVKGMHSRYRKFVDYGDNEAWPEQALALRKEFGDVQAEPDTAAKDQGSGSD